MAGRPKTPIEKQALAARGDGRTPGGRRVTQPGTVVVIPGRTGLKKEPAFDHSCLPKPPPGLKKEGKKIWFELWDNGPWLHPFEDHHLVAIIAKNYDLIAAFEKKIDETGLILSGGGYNGQDVANPLLKEIKSCEQVIMTCFSKLGFSPSDRARLGLAEIKRQSGLQDLQNRANAGKAK